MKRVHSLIAYSSSFFLLASLISEADFLICLLGVLYLSIYCAVVTNVARHRQLTFSMNLFLVFFAVGHVIKTGYVLLNKQIHQHVGWLTIGDFDFSFGAMSSLFMVEVATLLGGYFCIKLFLASKREVAVFDLKMESNNRSKYILLIWFVTSIFLIYYIDKIGFGRHGVQPDESSALPFGIGGFLVYFRNMAVPILGLVFLQWYLLANNKSQWLGYLAYLIVAVLLSLYSLSRGMFVIAMMPMIVMYVSLRKFSPKIIITLCMVSIVFLISMALVNMYRLGIYNNEVDVIGISAIVSSVLSLDQIFVMIEAFVSRVEGSRELMAVISSDIKGVNSLYETFFFGSRDVIENVMGFYPEAEGFAFGITYGLSGLLFISGNYIIVFVGTFLYLVPLLVIERRFLNRGYNMASIFLSFIIFLNIWGNMTWFFFYRFYFMAVFIIIVIELVQRFIFVRGISQRSINNLSVAT